MITPSPQILNYLKPEKNYFTDEQINSIAKKYTKNVDSFIDYVIYNIYQAIMKNNSNWPSEKDVVLDQCLTNFCDNSISLCMHETVVQELNQRVNSVFSNCIQEFSIVDSKICNTYYARNRLDYHIQISKNFTFPSLEQLPNPKETVGTSLYQAYCNGEFCDSTILVGTEEEEIKIPFHKSVLLSRAPVFKDMFQATENELDLGTYSEKSVRVFLEFIYTDWVAPQEELTAREISFVANLAAMCALPRLMEWCSRELTKKITSKTFLEIDKIAQVHKLDNLQNWLEVRIHASSDLRESVANDLRSRFSKQQSNLLKVSDSNWLETKDKLVSLVNRLGLSSMEKTIQDFEEDRDLEKNKTLDNELTLAELL